jgi:hypothetical protein
MIQNLQRFIYTNAPKKIKAISEPLKKKTIRCQHQEVVTVLDQSKVQAYCIDPFEPQPTVNIEGC